MCDCQHCDVSEYSDSETTISVDKQKLFILGRSIFIDEYVSVSDHVRDVLCSVGSLYMR